MKSAVFLLFFVLYTVRDLNAHDGLTVKKTEQLQKNTTTALRKTVTEKKAQNTKMNSVPRFCDQISCMFGENDLCAYQALDGTSLVNATLGDGYNLKFTTPGSLINTTWPIIPVITMFIDPPKQNRTLKISTTLFKPKGACQWVITVVSGGKGTKFNVKPTDPPTPARDAVWITEEITIDVPKGSIAVALFVTPIVCDGVEFQKITCSS